MPDLPPYVEAKEYIRVRAWVRGFPVEAVVLGWRGDRVDISWMSERGTHLGWVPAADVDGAEGCGSHDGSARQVYVSWSAATVAVMDRGVT